VLFFCICKINTLEISRPHSFLFSLLWRVFNPFHELTSWRGLCFADSTTVVSLRGGRIVSMMKVLPLLHFPFPLFFFSGCDISVDPFFLCKTDRIQTIPLISKVAQDHFFFSKWMARRSPLFWTSSSPSPLLLPFFLIISKLLGSSDF